MRMARIIAHVQNHQGSVIKYTGDGVMAV